MLSKYRLYWTTLFIALTIATNVTAQKYYGNEWIKSDQTYLKIPVTENGFYHITKSDFETVRIDPVSIPVHQFQLYRRGKEVAIEVATDSNGQLDHIGFYGQKNDGVLDSSLYVQPKEMPHSYYSLYSDTAAYFLTWHSSEVGSKRIVNELSNNTKNPQNFNLQISHQVFNSHYPPGNFYPTTGNYDNSAFLTTYDVGEGWTGPEIGSGNVNTINFTTEKLINIPEQPATLELVLVGRSAGTHQMEGFMELAGNQMKFIDKINFENYSSKKITIPLNNDHWSPNSGITISIKNTSKSGSFSISSAKLIYPQTSELPTTSNQKTFWFIPENPIDWHLNNSDIWQFYDITNPYSTKKITPQNNILAIEGKNIITIRDALPILRPKLVHFDPIDDKSINYLIISHPILHQKVGGIDPVEAYGKYRATSKGGDFKPLVLNIEGIYDRFNYGEPSPRAIRNAIEWLYENTNLQFVFLIGKSIDPQTARKNKNARNIDMIPNAGWPGSDMPLTMNLGGSGQFIPLVPIGRLNTSNPSEVLAYLNKVKNLEAQPASAPWRKNILHLSGGRSSSELQVFREYVDSFKKKTQNSHLAPNITTISKKTDAEVEQFDLHEPINNGVGLVTMFGHSGLNMADIDIGFASDFKLNYKNDPLYPAFLANGCSLGNFYHSIPTISNDWITSAKNGAVLFLSHTHNGFINSLKHYTDSFYEVLTDSNFSNQAFGTIQKEAITRVIHRYSSIFEAINCQQMNLQGDPAIKIFPSNQPDYTWDSVSLKFTDPQGPSLTAWADSIKMEITILNTARYKDENIHILVERIKNNKITTSRQITTRSFPNSKQLILTIPNESNNGGIETWHFSIDPKTLLKEESIENNLFSTTLSMPEGGASPILPLDGYRTQQSKVTFIAVTTANKPNGMAIFEYSTDSTFERNVISKKIQADNFIATYTTSLADYNLYYWRVYMEGDEKRPSNVRRLEYSDNQNTVSPSLPEVIILPHPQVALKLLEGAKYKKQITFKNITNVAFTDSLSIVIQRKHGNSNEILIKKIKPLKGHESFTFPIEFATIAHTGFNYIDLEFNSKRLPEEVYNNNFTTFHFDVIPDKIPPIIRVQADNHYLTKDETISPLPEFKIEITDDNPYLIIVDTVGIEVTLSTICLECTETRLFLKNATWKNLPNSTFQVSLSLDKPLAIGTYLLKVSAKDIVGNQANPYEIRLSVTDESDINRLIVSPNPSSDWFKFRIHFNGNTAPSYWAITIFNLSGQTITKFETKPHLGINEWIWHPKNIGNGLYYYRIELDEQNHLWNDNSYLLKSGKLLFFK